MSTQAERTAQLERRLTMLLGKKSYRHHKTPCRGKYKGYYDYSLLFEDGSREAISTGRRGYLRNLEKAVEEFQYYRDHHIRLEALTRQVMERDNRQAVTLGMEPVYLEGIELQNTGIGFWAVARVRHMDQIHIHQETNFKYACMGISLRSDDPEGYFMEQLARPDDKLGDYRGEAGNRAACILFGHVRTWPEVKAA